MRSSSKKRPLRKAARQRARHTAKGGKAGGKAPPAPPAKAPPARRAAKGVVEPKRSKGGGNTPPRGRNDPSEASRRGDGHVRPTPQGAVPGTPQRGTPALPPPPARKYGPAPNGFQGVAKWPPARAAFDYWKAGTSLRSLAQHLKVKRKILRNAFRRMAGGRAEFLALRKAGAGCQVLFNGQRARPKSQESGTVTDRDQNVQAIASTDIRHKVSDDVVRYARKRFQEVRARLEESGVSVEERRVLTTELKHTLHIRRARRATIDYGGWCSQTFVTPAGSALRLIDPQGRTYVQSGDAERADVLVVHTDPGLRPSRWKREEYAASTRKIAEAEALVERGEKKRAQKKHKKQKARRMHRRMRRSA